MKIFSLRILPLLSLAFVCCFSADTACAQSKPDTLVQISVSRYDSLTRSIDELRARVLLSDRSMDVLEKTNQQLSLWWNPYGLLISILGILFALLAIAATFILFRQSRDYRAMIADSITSYQSILNKFIDDKKAELDAKIEDTELKLSSAGTKQKKEIEATLAELKKRKDSMEIPSPTFRGYSTLDLLAGTSGSIPIGVYRTPYIGSLNVTAKCSKCGKEYPAIRHLPLAGSSTLTPVRCPDCGHEEYI